MLAACAASDSTTRSGSGVRPMKSRGFAPIRVVLCFTVRPSFSGGSLKESGSGATRDEFAGEAAIVGRAGGGRGVAQDRGAVSGGLRQLDGLPDDGVEERFSEAVSEVLLDLASERGSAIDEGQQDARHLEFVVQPLADGVEGLKHSSQAAERQRGRSNGDEDPTGGGQGADREKAQARRSVQKDEIVAGDESQLLAEEQLGADLSSEHLLGTADGQAGGYQVDARGRRRVNRERLAADDGLGERRAVIADTEALGRGALRVEIDDEYPTSLLG